jgi:hypothetical protein
MLSARNIVFFAVMFGGSTMRDGCSCSFVKFARLRIESLRQDVSSMESLHRATRTTIGRGSPASADSETTQPRSLSDSQLKI